ASLTATQAGGTNLGIGEFFAGAALALLFQDPAQDSRTPDFILNPTVGVVYANKATKIAEHGGFNEDDVHVALLVSHPAPPPAVVDAAVATTQIAPTILKALKLDPNELDAVRAEGTTSLPGLD